LPLIRIIITIIIIITVITSLTLYMLYVVQVSMTFLPNDSPMVGTEGNAATAQVNTSSSSSSLHHHHHHHHHYIIEIITIIIVVVFLSRSLFGLPLHSRGVGKVGKCMEMDGKSIMDSLSCDDAHIILIKLLPSCG